MGFIFCLLGTIISLVSLIATMPEDHRIDPERQLASVLSFAAFGACLFGALVTWPF